MRGIEYLVDEEGNRTAVQIDLKSWGKLWEDFYDVLVSEARKHEPTVPWDALKRESGQEDKQTA